MTLNIFGVILFAAALHATWNAIVKRGSDKLMTTGLVTGSAAFIAAAALPFLTSPDGSSWPFIAASTFLQIGYFVLVARTYRSADMSQAYPLMRGSAPVLVALSSVAVLGQKLGPLAWLGIAVICVGIVGMAVGRRSGKGGGILLALSNAVVIAAYTLVDGVGVRKSGAPAAYTLWIFLLTGVPLTLWLFRARPRLFRSYILGNWHLGMVGGYGAVASYGLALWAMTMVPVAVVAALRETSILAGVAISGLVLHERVSPARVMGACAISAGAAILRLS